MEFTAVIRCFYDFFFILFLIGLAIILETFFGYELLPIGIKRSGGWFLMLGLLGIISCYAQNVIARWFDRDAEKLGVRPNVPGLCRRNKTLSSGKSDAYEFACVEVQGWRPSMEDASLVQTRIRRKRLDANGPEADSDNGKSKPARPADEDPRFAGWHLFAVFDGHGGAQVSRWLADSFPDCLLDVASRVKAAHDVFSHEEIQDIVKIACRDLDYKLKLMGMFELVGSTCNCVLVNERWLVCANVGDSRCVLGLSNGGYEDVSEDHKPELPSERQRIERAGGSVLANGPCYRVDGWGLNLSRAFGDFHYKRRADLSPMDQKVCAEPEVTCVDLSTKDWRFVVIGCDGVFEMGSADVVATISCNLYNGLRKTVEKLADHCISPSLIRTQGRGGDNVSAILIRRTTESKPAEVTYH